MRSVELFAGAAGLALGTQRAGFHHEIVVERDHAACKTIRHNQRLGFAAVQGWKVLEADVATLDLSDVASEPDLLSGGPPCQPFSIGGEHAGANDERNCWPWTINATRILRPRAVLFENVPGLLRFTEYLDYLKLALGNPGLSTPGVDWREDAAFLRAALDAKAMSDPRYRISVVKLDATNYGLAQARTRVFIVGLREDVAQEWEAPEATHSSDQLMTDKWITGSYWDRHNLARPEMDDAGVRYLRKHNRATSNLFAQRLAPHRTVRDAIGDLPEAMPGGSPGIHNHEAAPREAKVYKGHTGSPIDEPSKTLRAGVHGVSGGENLVDYGAGHKGTRYRHFTVREAARLTGMDDEYQFPGTWSDGLKQLGNAVGVDMAAAMGKSLARVLSH
jgi:DNA (cytosine-5)-methyltransferase 1